MSNLTGYAAQATVRWRRTGAMDKRYQFVKWFPDWFGVGFEKFGPNCGLYTIYEWCLYLGWWEVRKWVRPQDGERRLAEADRWISRMGRGRHQ